MPLPLVPVALSMGTLAAAFLFGKGAKPETQTKAETPEQKAAAKVAKKAAASHDWQNASVEALISRDDDTIRAVVRAMHGAGKHDEADSLIRASKEQKAPKGKPKTKPKAKAVSKPTSSAPKPVSSVVKPLPKSLTPEEKQAVELASMLRSSTRGSENKTQVAAYQKTHALAADGKYGPASARTLWNIFKIVPPNPYYWPSSNTQSALNSYSKFLDTIAIDNPKHAEKVKSLKATLGR